ncbi:MAG: chorismate-binding protein [Actinomycetota bacterium]
MDSLLWMGGRLATNLEEISHDLTSLTKPGFWAVVGSFENEWTLARFATVIEAELPSTQKWIPLSAQSWKSSFTIDSYCDYVSRIRTHIADGDVYQVNACRILSAPNHSNDSLLALARKIVKENPAPFASFLKLPSLEIASASPERFISFDGEKVMSSPIKGTSPTTDFLEKDRAENLMIVDLIRNDMSSTARIGSVSTPRLLATEEHPGLFHLVSDVRSEIRDGCSIIDVLRSMMPPGSVSGAPKSSALRIIKENEGARGPYCGTIGWVEGNRAELSVGIRTFWQTESELKFGTGAGITWGSDPMQEWEETELKARKLIGLASS